MVMSSDPIKQFELERDARIVSLSKDLEFKERSRAWLEESMRKSYVYNFSWLGRPIIQNPIDIIAMQEIIWSVKPDLIIETGVAHGGSILFSASMLELNAQCGGPVNAQVVGIDIDIREHNRKAIEQHSMAKRITMIQGSSIDPIVIDQVKAIAKDAEKILVCLDSNHTHEHVLTELNAYASLTSIDSYCVVFDSFIEDVPADVFNNRPWGPGNNPKTAVWEFLKLHPEFEIDSSIHNKLLITVAPDGYLKRIK